MIYRLKRPWVLRGWVNEPFCAHDPTGENAKPVRPMPFSRYSTLLLCDGVTELEPDRELKLLINDGLIEPGTGPLEREQHYDALVFKRRAFALLRLPANGGGPLSAQDYSDIVAQLLDCGVDAVRVDGEALLAPDFWPMAEALSARHMRLERLSTDGSALLDEALKRLTKLRLRPSVCIDFDGVGTHDALRGVKGAEKQAVGAIMRAKARNFPLRCTLRVNRVNAQRLLMSCRFLRDLGVNSLVLLRDGMDSDVDERQICLTSQVYGDLCQKIERVVTRENWRVEFEVIDASAPGPDGARAYRRLSRSAPNCEIAEGLIIEEDGRMRLCDAFERALPGTGEEDDRLPSKRLRTILTRIDEAAAEA